MCLGPAGRCGPAPPCVALLFVALLTTCSPPPGDADEVLLRVHAEQGPLPGGQDEFVLYGDGRAVFRAFFYEEEAPFEDRSPVPVVLEQELQPGAVENLLERAAEAGLTDEDQSIDGLGGPSTTFTTTTDDGTVATRVSSIEHYGGSEERTWQSRSARYALNDFYARLFYLSAWLPGGSVSEATAHEFDRLLVLSALEPLVHDDAVTADWPLGDLAGAGAEVRDPAGYGDQRCMVLEGSDRDTVLAAAETAIEQRSRPEYWSSGDRSYRVEFQPLLEGEAGCERFGQ